jgi:hypothetical protein
MDMYKQASRIQLRFQTTAGSLSAEQLWSLNMTQLSNAIKNVRQILKKSSNDDDLQFLDENNKPDVENQLRFEILKDVYLTKQSENKEAQLKLDRKKEKEKILRLLSEKQEASLANKSEAELLDMLKGLED